MQADPILGCPLPGHLRQLCGYRSARLICSSQIKMDRSVVCVSDDRSGPGALQPKLLRRIPPGVYLSVCQRRQVTPHETDNSFKRGQSSRKPHEQRMHHIADVAPNGEPMIRRRLYVAAVGTHHLAHHRRVRRAHQHQGTADGGLNSGSRHTVGHVCGVSPFEGPATVPTRRRNPTAATVPG